MCINIIQEKLTNTFREASTKLKVQFSKIMESSAMTGDCIEGPVIEGPVLDASENDDSGYIPNPATIRDSIIIIESLMKLVTNVNNHKVAQIYETHFEISFIS
ncbi:hypothetical protein Anas_13685 [Armadillidium nasatum]|uniref:Uncharacterized protein n=1 Tax=Armadillidium nasatum TaxID=96803 RepID=A0A5N5T8V6_9CRUS|nr:hypothetical protein Anas_13685 [Armadillidium nasatum]